MSAVSATGGGTDKCIDITSSGTTISTTARTLQITAVAEGFDRDNRVGRLIKLCRWEIRASLSNALATDGVRMVLAYDRQSNGAGGQFSSFIQSSGNILSSYNFGGWDRYDVIWDALIPVVPNTDSQLQLIDECFDLQCRPTVFSGATAGSADTVSGSLYLFVLGTIASASPNVTIFNMYSRLFFEDE